MFSRWGVLCTPVWLVLNSSQHTSIRAFLSLIWWLIFFTVSHIFLFLCVPGKFGVDARRSGFYFVGYGVFCAPSCACSWAVCDSLQWLEPVESDWPCLGPVLPEGSACGPEWAPFSTQAARDSLILENSGGVGGGGVLSIPGYCVLSTELWGNPLSSVALY